MIDLNPIDQLEQHAGVSGQPESEESIDLIAVFRSIWGKRFTVLPFSVIAAILSIAFSLILPNKYTASVAFIPPSSPSTSSLMALSGQLSGMGMGGLLGGVKNSGDMYAGILQSDFVTRRMVSQFGLMQLYKRKKMSQAQKTLVANTEIKVGTKDSIIHINVTDKDPARARDLANGYLDSLDAATANLAISEASKRRAFFEKQLVQEKEALANAEVDLRKTEEQTGVVQPTGQTALQLNAIARIRAEISSTQAQLAALLQSATEQNPEVARLRRSIENLQEQLREMQAGNEDFGNLPTSKVPGLALENVRKLREVKYHETLFEALAKQYEAARLDEAKDVAMIQVLDTATIPDTKSGPPRLLIVLGATLVGTILGIIFVLVRSYRGNQNVK